MYTYKSGYSEKEKPITSSYLFGSPAVSSFATDMENINLYFELENIPFLHQTPASELEFFNLNYEKVMIEPSDLMFLINNSDSTIVSE
ncbi:MAG: hypothetical protein WBN28_08125, partial [Lutimonas sp.]